jgi:predicted DNA binding CopG/RHH family protein
MHRYDPQYLDKEEKELIQDVKRMDVTNLKKPTQKAQTRLRRATKIFVERETKMNIRIAPSELAQIKAKAEREGLKYQTLVKSVLHKYLTGQLVERKEKIG